MLSALLLLLQTPSMPYADLWIPECKERLSVEGPRGYRDCARAANEARERQVALREAEYRDLLEQADRSEDLARLDADKASFEIYQEQHCSYIAGESASASVLAANRELSCRYYLNDRRIAEINRLILLFTPAYPGQNTSGF